MRRAMIAAVLFVAVIGVALALLWTMQRRVMYFQRLTCRRPTKSGWPLLSL